MGWCHSLAKGQLVLGTNVGHVCRMASKGGKQLIPIPAPLAPASVPSLRSTLPTFDTQGKGEGRGRRLQSIGSGSHCHGILGMLFSLWSLGFLICKVGIMIHDCAAHLSSTCKGPGAVPGDSTHSNSRELNNVYCPI